MSFFGGGIKIKTSLDEKVVAWFRDQGLSRFESRERC
jgi:hypothetical protein